MELEALSDSAIIIRFGAVISPEINRRVHLLAAALAADPLPGVGECVPGYASLVVHYDPAHSSHEQVAGWLAARSDAAHTAADRPPRRIEVPVRYGGPDGPDLEDVAARCRLSPEQVIRFHSQADYSVYMIGFTPGFAYLGSLPEALRVPRLAAPRPLVQARSVAIAAAQTGIYPVDSPGGWRLIGRTPLLPFDPLRSEPFLFAPGDSVRFIPVEA